MAAVLSVPAIAAADTAVPSPPGCQVQEDFAGYSGRVLALDQLVDAAYLKYSLSSRFRNGSNMSIDRTQYTTQSLLTLVRRVHAIWTFSPNSGYDPKMVANAVRAWNTLRKVEHDQLGADEAYLDLKAIDWPTFVTMPAEIELKQAVLYFRDDLNSLRTKRAGRILSSPAFWQPDDLEHALNIYDALLKSVRLPKLVERLRDANGLSVSVPPWVIQQNRADDWLIQQWAAGARIAVLCSADHVHTSHASTGGLQWGGFSDLGATAERDTLALKAFGLKDPLVGSPTFSVQPGTDPAGKSTYDVNVQGAVGYTFLKRVCDLNSTDCKIPWALTALFDAFYGVDKNAPMGVTTKINRLGAGLDFAMRFDGDQLAGTLQILPEYITDTSFAAETFYGEVRFDVLRVGKGSNWPTCFGKDAYQPPILGMQLSCGIAVIVDAGYNAVPGLQNGVFQNFARAGGEIGFGISPQPGLCSAGWLCKDFFNRLSASAWYKILPDISGNKASIHNFTGQLSFRLTGGDDGNGGLALAVQYTHGIEDVTLYKLPTWNVGFKGSF